MIPQFISRDIWLLSNFLPCCCNSNVILNNLLFILCDTKIIIIFIYFLSSLGESIPICALIENLSSRLVVPKAVIYQIQTYMAKGKKKIIKRVVASASGNVVPSDCSSRWNGNALKIPPVSPSILNSDILKVEYLLAVCNNFMMIMKDFFFFLVSVTSRFNNILISIV